MSVAVVPSAKLAAKRTKKSSTSRKRRQNENIEIDELASLVPWTSPPSTASNSLVAANSGNKPPTIAVLRLTSTFLKLQNFVKDTSTVSDSCGDEFSTSNLMGRMEEAIDGFLLVLDKDANILYVSESIAGYVGLIQQDVIGQNLADITYPEYSSDITDTLKPTLLLPSTEVDEFVVSQNKQFHVKFKPSVSYSTQPSHSIVQVRGNLKVKLSTVTNNKVKFVKPSVVGFVGECRVYDSFSSIPELFAPRPSFVVTKSADMKRILTIEATVREIIGYDPDILLSKETTIKDFLHPADVHKVHSSRQRVLRTGHGIGPRVRFLSGFGEWIWIQAELHLRHKSETAAPQYWEIKIRALSQCGSQLPFMQQRELCPPMNICNTTSKLVSISDTSKNDGVMPVPCGTESVDSADVTSEPVIGSCDQGSPRSLANPTERSLDNHHGLTQGHNNIQLAFSTETMSAQDSPPTSCSTFSSSSSLVPTSASDSLDIVSALPTTCTNDTPLPLHINQGSLTDRDGGSISDNTSPLGSTLSSHSQFQLSPLSQSSVSSSDSHSIAQLDTSPASSDLAGWSEMMWADAQIREQFQPESVLLTDLSMIQAESPPLSCSVGTTNGTVYETQVDFDPDQLLNISNFINTDAMELCSSFNIAAGFRGSCLDAGESFYSGSVNSVPASPPSVQSTPGFTPSTDFNPQIPSSFDFSSTNSPTTTPQALKDFIPHLDDSLRPTFQVTRPNISNLWIDCDDSVMQQLFSDVSMQDLALSDATLYQSGDENSGSSPTTLHSTRALEGNFVQNSVSSQSLFSQQPKSNFVSQLQNTIYSCSTSNILQQFI